MTEYQFTHQVAEAPHLMPRGPYAADMPADVYLRFNGETLTEPTPGIAESVPSEAVSDQATVIPTVEQAVETIPDSDIRAYHDRDGMVHSDIEQARMNIASGLGIADADKIQRLQQSKAAIEAARRLYRNEYEKAATAANLLIASIQEQLNITKEGLLATSGGIIAEHERVIDAVANTEQETKRIADMISIAVDGMDESQSKHESNRDKAINDIDLLVAHRTALTEERSRLQDEIKIVIARRFAIQEDRDLLLKEKVKLRKDQDKQREYDIGSIYRNALQIHYGFTPGSDELNAALEKIEEEGDFPKLKEIENKIKTWEEELERNTVEFTDTTTKISHHNLRIKEINTELSQIPGAINDARMKLDREVDLVANEQDTKSRLAVLVAKTFEDISRGDMDAVAKNTLPDTMLALWDKKVAMLQTASVANGNEQLKEWEAPSFSLDMDLLLQLTPDSPTAVEDGIDRVKTIAKGSEDLAMIKRGTVRSIGEAIIGRVTKPRTAYQYVKQATETRARKV